MAVLKKVRDAEHPSERKHLVMPAFSFATDSTNAVSVGLANMIIDAWNNVPYTYTLPTAAVVTITIAAPGLITWPDHGLAAGSAVQFATTGALPTGLTAGTNYYVTANAALTTNTFNVSDTQVHALAGTNTVTTTGAQNGVQKVNVVTVNLGDTLMQRDHVTKLPTQNAVDCATTYVQQARVGLVDLSRAVVITEKEHENDYVMQSDNEIVFVLPDQNRSTITPNPAAHQPYPPGLLATAQLLMACTPNGI